MTNRVFVVSAERTAVGKLGGALKNIQPDDLLVPLFASFQEKNYFPLEQIDEVIIGQAKQSQDQSNIARKTLLKASFPESLPGYTVHRQCGSGMQAIQNAFMAIKAGVGHCYLAGGVESMSTAPYYLRNARFGYLAGNAELLDPNKESQPGSQPEEIYGRLTMGATAENLAEDYKISREDQDRFALSSQEKAHAAIRSGRFKEEIVPVPIPSRKGVTYFDTDEHPRETSIEQLGKLKPVFIEGGSVTAGNSSGLNDGASLLCVVSEEFANKYDLLPIAEISSIGVSGVAPDRMGIGPVEATRRALHNANLTLNQIDLVELNEAFAAQSLAVLRELELSEEKVNVNGGAIALGHPIGNSGARICVSLLHEMKKREVENGLATLCIAGGQGITTVFKRV
jgi:acetyl-CoA C-acetyltransferase